MGFFLFVKSLGAIWPFLKELLLGNKTIREALMRNKLTTAFVVVNVFMFILFVYIYSVASERSTAVTQGVTSLSALQKHHDVEVENLKRQIDEKDKHYIPLVEAKDRELRALQARLDAVVMRLDAAGAQNKTNLSIIETLRQQIETLQRLNNNNHPSPARDAFTEQLERLKRQERELSQ